MKNVLTFPSYKSDHHANTVVLNFVYQYKCFLKKCFKS